MASQSAPPCIVWFRDDLRLSDHPALHAAASTGRPVICLYVFDEPSRSADARPLGGAARWWLAQSLRALQKRLDGLGTQLVLRKGPAAKIIAEMARTTGAGAVFWNEIAQAPHQATAGDVAAALREIGVTSQSFPGDLLAAPADIRSKEGRGLRVFTPFWRRVQALGDPPKPLPAPDRLRPGPNLASDTLESWRLEPTRPDWAGGLRDTWAPGELARPAAAGSVSPKWSGRLCKPARPARPRRHLQALAAPALWRDQPAPGLARRAFCHGRAPCPVGRRRQIPQ